MNILVASDGSKSALHVVKYAIGLIQSLASTSHCVNLISVHDDAGLRHSKSIVGKQVVADYLRERSEKDLKQARKLLDVAGVDYRVEIRTGHVAQEILQCAKVGKCDLIALGAKGLSAMADLLLGSVAQRVLASAKQPVVLVK